MYVAEIKFKHVKINSACPRGLDPFYIVAYEIWKDLVDI